MQNKNLRSRETTVFILNIVSILLLSIMFVLVWRHLYYEILYFYLKGNFVILLVYFIVLSIMWGKFDGLSLGKSETRDVVYSQSLSLFLSNVLMYFIISLIAYQFVPVGGFFFILLIQIILDIILCNLDQVIFYHHFAPLRCILIYGNGYDEIKDKLLRHHSKDLNIISLLEITGDKDAIRSAIDDCEQVLLAGVATQDQKEIVSYCYSKTKSVVMVPSLYEVIVNKGVGIHYIDTPLLQVNRFGPSQYAKLVKRTADIILSFVALIVLSPIFLIVAIAIKANDGGPVFYRQNRMTQYGRVFSIIKFRSMKINSEADGKAVLAKENDDRITSVGKFIRRCRIDELPQLINILTGDMSIVGPRPERPEIATEIEKTCPEFSARLKVKAGLTGYAQVYGKYNTNLQDKLLLDLQYIEDYSLSLDFKIILMTIKVIFQKESTEGVQ